MKKRERRPEPADGGWINTMCELLKGGVLAGIVSIVGLLFCAVLMSAGVLREAWMEGTVLAVCAVSALAGGLYAENKIRSRAMLVGIGVGIVLCLLLLVAGVLAYRADSIGEGGTGVLCACLCGGAMAGILGRRPKKKRKR